MNNTINIINEHQFINDFKQGNGRNVIGMLTLNISICRYVCNVFPHVLGIIINEYINDLIIVEYKIDTEEMCIDQQNWNEMTINLQSVNTFINYKQLKFEYVLGTSDNILTGLYNHNRHLGNIIPLLNEFMKYHYDINNYISDDGIKNEYDTKSNNKTSLCNIIYNYFFKKPNLNNYNDEEISTLYPSNDIELMTNMIIILKTIIDLVSQLLFAQL